MTLPCFYIFRHHNAVLVDQFMENHNNSLDPNKNLANQQSINANHLKAMKFLARSREAADRSKMSFFGSFVTDKGYHYSVTNINQDEIDRKTVQYLIDLQLNESFDIDQVQQRLQIVETNEGVQMRITDEPSVG
jgi:hypothetical protein